MRKILSLLLSVILVLTVIPTFQVAAAKEPTFVISNAKGEVGDTVKITVSTKNNPGVISMQICVKYDSSVLKLIDHKEGVFKGVTFGPKTKNPFIATWIDPLKPNNDTDGVLVTLEFEVLDTAPNGKSEISLTYDPENVFEYNTSAKDNFNNITFEVENGYVDVKNPDGPKQPSTSSQESNVDASVDEDTNAIYEQIIEDMLNDPENIKVDNTDKDSDTSNNSGTITTDGATNADDNNANSDSDTTEPTNGWLIWVVVAAILVLGAAFVIVIVKGKKSKH